MLSERAERALNRATTSGVIALAVAGFAMSYDALHSLALTQGVPDSLAWLWPLVVDGFIVVPSLSVVRAVADGHRATYPWLLVLAFSVISIAFNVAHAIPTPVARLVAAIPPAALVLSFELLTRQLRAASSPTTNAAPHAATHPSFIDALPRPASTPQLTAPTSDSPLLERARGMHLAARRADQRMTGALLARQLGISDGYARRLLRQLAPDAGDAA